MDEIFKKRIEYTGKLEDISYAICKSFNLGEFLSNKLILIGYEDFNFILETTKGKYFIKVFANFRDEKNCQRYVDILKETLKAKIKTPKLFKSDQGYLYNVKINNSNLRLCVMEYFENSLYDLKKRVTVEEIKFLSNQIALINSLDIKVDFVYDSWSVPNFKKEFKKKSKYLEKTDLDLITPLLNEFDELNIESLPHCFVHGDIIGPNVMKGKDSNLFIIDFSVSNYYPRIQDLTILACDLLFDPKSKSKSEENLQIALEEYQKYIKLTEKELTALPIYIKAAYAMYILCANYEKVAKNFNSEENEHWLERGRIGLKQMT
jgi:Ser/Thr protein kinase RdoA (MazF antagonist)